MAKKPKKVKKTEDTKKHPVSEDSGKDINLKARDLDKFIEQIEHDTQQDIESTTTHRQGLAHWYSRRHGVLDKDPQYPWPGSSNITMPLIDMEVTKDKAPLMQTLEITPIVSFQAVSLTGFEKSDAAEHTMQWLLSSQMRDFKRNMEVAIDNKAMYGYGLVKTVYEYRTEVITETIRKEELDPTDLEQIAVLLAQIQDGVPIGQDQQGNPIIPTEEDFEIAVSQLAAIRWGLNVEDEIDQNAITNIMNFILNEDEEVEIKRNYIVQDAPYLTSVDPDKFFPEEGVMDLQDAERLTEVFVETINEMKQKARNGWYNADAVDKIIKQLQQTEDSAGQAGATTDSNISSFSQLENERRQREGITSTTRSGVIENKEVYCMYDIDGDGVKERCLLIYNPATKIRLRFMEFPYEHGEWPYVQIRNEETDGRFHSPRGIGEILNDIDDMITQNHRNKLNAMQIGNSPTFKYRLGSNINPSNMQWVPGQFYPVMNMGDFEQVQVNVKDFSFDNEEGQLRFWSEGLLGSFDAAFREQRSESRTATEVAAIEGVQQSAQSLKIARFQRDMKRVYKQIWSLWMQYGPPNFTVSISNGELKQLSKFEVNGEFDLMPVGTIGNTNPQGEFLKSQQRFQMIAQMAQAGMLGLIGDEYELDIGAAFKDMMNKDDFVASNRILRKRSDEEIQQIQAQRQAQEQAQAQQQAGEQAIEQNRPMGINELQSTLKNIEKQSPNGGAQRIG